MDLLDIVTPDEQPNFPNTVIGRFDRYNWWAPRVLGYNVQAYVISVPTFVRLMDEVDNDPERAKEYKGIPIIVNKDELRLDVVAILT